MKRVGILRGGTDENYENSLREGGTFIVYIIENLSDGWKPVDILIDRDGVWHTGGIPVLPSDLVSRVDVVWNFSHPRFSNILESFSIPNIKPSSFLGDSRDMLREHMKSIGVSMPRRVDNPKSAQEVFEKFTSPWIVKNSNEIKLVKTFNELAETINGKNDVIVEEFITGKPSAVHTLRGFREDLPAQAGDVYVFPLGKDFTLNEKEEVVKVAKNLHQHIGAEHYLKADFTLNPKKGFILTGLYFLPDIREDSHLNQACNSVGAKMNHVIEHILKQAV
jgi:D-alanine-D-alanine ligase-like ATP-grasp enzyme